MNSTKSTWPLDRYAVVGSGRLGTALVQALPSLAGPLGRGFDGTGYDVVILAVPDSQISTAAAAIKSGPIVGHCSGATGLDVLAPHQCFSLHPLMTVTTSGAQFVGAGAALAGSTAEALSVAAELARQLGLVAVTIAEVDRGAYHAAASIAANFLVTLEDAAARLMATAGASREILVPLVRAAVENWAAEGARALTGPIARGDQATVARQREAVATRTPDLLELFDAMVSATQAVATRNAPC
jgi:predicted short-subunit dehydrogenase-like oxidoreductase (DUF2520 family)